MYSTRVVHCGKKLSYTRSRAGETGVAHDRVSVSLMRVGVRPGGSTSGFHALHLRVVGGGGGVVRVRGQASGAAHEKLHPAVPPRSIILIGE